MIYFLEDDNSIRELVVYTMNSTGFEAVGFGKPGEFWAAMERETREVSGRLRGEMQRLNKFMSAMETAEKAEENP